VRPIAVIPKRRKGGEHKHGLLQEVGTRTIVGQISMLVWHRSFLCAVGDIVHLERSRAFEQAEAEEGNPEARARAIFGGM